MSKRKNFNRKKILKQISHCQRCGCKGILHIHHKDGDKSNSDPGNAEVLCLRCHILVHINLPYQQDYGMLKSEFEAFRDAILLLDANTKWKRSEKSRLLIDERTEPLTKEDKVEIINSVAKKHGIDANWLNKEVLGRHGRFNN